MAREFRFRFNGTAKALVERLRSDCVLHGVSFEGDQKRGGVRGMGFRASYHIEGPEVSVLVLSIPFYISWGFLDRQVMKRAEEDYGAARID